MAIGRIKKPRPFKNSSTPGGSKKGKPQNLWPWVLKVVAEAIFIRSRGTMEAWLVDRNSRVAILFLRVEMEKYCSGCWKWIEENHSKTKTSKPELLHNRVYKMWYSGTSDRGKNHDPKTRATMSDEHWSKHLSPDHPLVALHDAVRHGCVFSIPNWRDYL